MNITHLPTIHHKVSKLCGNEGQSMIGIMVDMGYIEEVRQLLAQDALTKFVMPHVSCFAKEKNTHF